MRSRIPDPKTCASPRWSRWTYPMWQEQVSLVQGRSTRWRRVERGPEGEPPQVAVRHPVEPAREIGLDRGFLHMGEPGQPDQGVAIPTAGQRLAPGGEQDRDLVALALAGGDPVGEP